MTGEDYEAAKPVPTRTPAYGDPWVRGHDPMCGYTPESWSRDLIGNPCDCDLIARVREDERAAIRQPGRITLAVEDAYAKGRADALAEAREAVAAIGFDGDPRPVMTVMQGHYIKRDDALAAIDALRGES
jgi:hypothetical protein